MAEAVDIFAADVDLFRYSVEPIKTPTIKPLPQPPKPKLGMEAVKPSLGKPAVTPSPLPPDLKVMSQPHPEIPAKPRIRKQDRFDEGGRKTQDPYAFPKQHYTLMTPMEEAMSAAMKDINEEMASRSHPEDKASLQEDIDMIEAAYKAGNEKLFVHALAHSIPHTTFEKLVHVVKGTPASNSPSSPTPPVPNIAKSPEYEEEAALRRVQKIPGQKRPEGLFKVTGNQGGPMTAAKDGDIFRYQVDPQYTTDEPNARLVLEDEPEPVRHARDPEDSFAVPMPTERPRKRRGYSSIPGILLDIAEQKKAQEKASRQP